MKNLRNEEAVSPVIGVILMVVITVIIAAVLAVFAFGVGAPTQTPQASIKITSIDPANSNLSVQHYGGGTLRMKDVKLTVETLNGDGVMLETVAYELNSTVTGQFSAGDTLLIKTNASEASDEVAIWLNGVALGELGTNQNMVKNGDLDLTTAGVDSVRVTVIDTPSGSVLSKPSAKVT
jgi:flagellin-like protein